MSESYVVVALAGKPTKATIIKDPNATLDYSLDWSAWMALAPGDTIASLLMVLEAKDADVAPLVKVAQGIVSTLAIEADPDAVPDPILAAPAVHTTTAFISGGTAGLKYTVTFRITTASTPPRVEDRSIILDIRDR